MNMSLEELNSLSPIEARKAFMQCCTASRWIDLMIESRPFEDLMTCQDSALKNWAKMNEEDYLEAFEGHPKIGDVDSLRAKYADTKALASGEQSAVNDADENTILALAKGNALYEIKNGFIFIVCATGKSAAEMLQLLEARLNNSREEELVIAAGEQAKITAIRIEKLIQANDQSEISQ